MYVNLIGSSAQEINDMIVEVTLGNENTFAKQVLEAQENKTEIEKLVSQELGKPMHVRFVNKSEKSIKTKQENPIENIANNMDIPINIIDE